MREGDTISIDIPNYQLDLLVPESELTQRRLTLKGKDNTTVKGYLARYARGVSSAERGAIIK